MGRKELISELKKHNMSQAELGRRIGLTRGKICYRGANRAWKSKEIERAADVLELDNDAIVRIFVR